MDQNNYNKSKVIYSLFWKLLERGGTQGIQFVVQIILARLLLPKEFGTIAIVMVFINLAQVFVQSGFNIALVQKKEADEDDFSSIFYLSILVAGVLYICIYYLAPYIAKVYYMPILTPILRVLSCTLFTGAFNSIQNAFIARNLLFKKLFKSSLGAIIISGILGIGAAYKNFGVWSIVIQQLSNQVSITLILWFTVKWRPKLVFSVSKIKELFSFGSNLLMSSLLNTAYNEIRTLLIGRIYDPSILGYYNRGELFPKVIVSNIDGSIQAVMLPTLSANQDDKKRVKELMRRAILSSSFIIFPVMVGMIVTAEPLVKIILTEKWLPIVPFLRIACLSYGLMPIHTANLQAINAIGRSDVFLKLEIAKKIVGMVILCISIPFGIYSIAIGQFISGVISTFINSYPNKYFLDYSYKEQWIDVVPALIISIVMGTIVYLFNYMNIPPVNIISLQLIVGIISYIVLAKIFKLESFVYLFRTIKEVFINKK